MPELPEVESVLRSLRDGVPSLQSRVISRVCILWDGLLSNKSPESFNSELEGMTFSTFGRYGKYLILGLQKSGINSRKSFLIVHLRMTGRLFLVKTRFAIERHTRMVLMLDNDLALRFDDPRKFGRVWLVDEPADVISGLGPDALTVSYDDFKSRIYSCNRQVKPLLLDQSFVAGIGNIYADESLFRAGIHPLTPSLTLTDKDVVRLFNSIGEVLEEAVKYSGANIDGVFGEGDFIVSVYRRTGKPCPKCGTIIIKTRISQRGTHICPTCQPFNLSLTRPKINI